LLVILGAVWRLLAPNEVEGPAAVLACHSERSEESPHFVFARHSGPKAQNLCRCRSFVIP